ncbi:MAG: DNA/RNA non-specific endonuclease [Chitinophagaceae bacterium]|nr:DNA/RNA non-specific endonuclease [Chitinophagaceae bacterium]
MLLDLDLIESSTERYNSGSHSVHKKMISPNLLNTTESYMDSDQVSAPVTEISPEENLQKRKVMLEAIRSEPPEFAYERAIGKNDSVYSNFIDLLDVSKKKVARVVIKEGNKAIGFATGFMVSPELMLTNWHVFKSKADVRESEIQFQYELDSNGRPKPSVSFLLNPDRFFYSYKDLDYCFIAVNSVDVTGQRLLIEFGYAYMDPNIGKLANVGQESLNIIHHPNGDYKQLSIRENLFTKITDTTVWYESDTAQGSSGSPVFNDQWQLVALHHMGVPLKNDQGMYLDKNGDIIHPVDRKIDESRVVWIANEGIRVSVIVHHFFGIYSGNSIAETLKVKPGNPDAISSVRIEPAVNNQNTQQELNTMETSTNDQIQISVPSSLLKDGGSINIQIQTGNNSGVQNNTGSEKMISDEALLEIKKNEQEIDYVSCKGYSAMFLGIEIPFPELSAKLKKFVAPTKSGRQILKYHYFSVIMHAVRKMPIVSAINIDGNPDLRKDDTERADKWIRDIRMDFEYQLDDAFYKYSGFDRGHMSRREDANYGKTPEIAKRNADLTCIYTNACPQVGALNQSKLGGLWGKLEKIVLEKGAIKEQGKQARITVFNGPIFHTDDPVYKSIQIPMSFYKVVCWLSDKKELKTTAFILSQEDLVEDISFEQLDIDQNIEFQPYQVSIKQLQKLTGLQFSDVIVEADTFDSSNVEEERLIITEESCVHGLKGI